MKSNENIEKMANLFEKYGLRNVISEDDQQFILNKKLHVYTHGMKSIKKMGTLSVLFSGLYFFFKKHMLLSILVKKILILTITSFVIGGTSYLVYNHFFNNDMRKSDVNNEIQIPLDDSRKITQSDEFQNQKIAENIKNTENEKADIIDYDKIKYDIRIQPFKSTTLDKNDLSKMANKFKAQLGTDQKENFVIISSVINSSNCNFAISFLLEEYDGEYVINVKMIDVNTSKIEMLDEYTVDSKEDLDRLWLKVSEDVRVKID